MPSKRKTCFIALILAYSSLAMQSAIVTANADENPQWDLGAQGGAQPGQYSNYGEQPGAQPDQSDQPDQPPQQPEQTEATVRNGLPPCRLSSFVNDAKMHGDAESIYGGEGTEKGPDNYKAIGDGHLEDGLTTGQGSVLPMVSKEGTSQSGPSFAQDREDMERQAANQETPPPGDGPPNDEQPPQERPSDPQAPPSEE